MSEVPSTSSKAPSKTSSKASSQAPSPSKAADKPPGKEAGAAAKSAPQKAMERMGLTRDIDLALHLPLRYEDETQLTPLDAAHDGDTVQCEGEVIECRIEIRGRRQLLVKLRDDHGGQVQLRFLHFYPAHQKTMAVGTRIRARGEIRVGFFGREMVHPSFRKVDAQTPLATSLTPVYPTSAQLPQAYLRKAVASALKRVPLDEVLPPGIVPAGLPSLRETLQFLHHPPPSAGLSTLEDHTHPPGSG